jgi:aminoglycoside N3'-acetyltransferase
MGRQGNSTNPAHRPLTQRELLRDLRSLGVVAGQTLLVHVSIGSKDGGLDGRCFRAIGRSMDQRRESSVKEWYVGNAGSRLVPLVQAVDRVKRWMAQHRV